MSKSVFAAPIRVIWGVLYIGLLSSSYVIRVVTSRL